VLSASHGCTKRGTHSVTNGIANCCTLGNAHSVPNDCTNRDAVGRTQQFSDSKPNTNPKRVAHTEPLSHANDDTDSANRLPHRSTLCVSDRSTKRIADSITNVNTFGCTKCSTYVEPHCNSHSNTVHDTHIHSICLALCRAECISNCCTHSYPHGDSHGRTNTRRLHRQRCRDVHVRRLAGQLHDGCPSRECRHERRDGCAQ
jgi:hypothetical protein